MTVFYLNDNAFDHEARMIVSCQYGPRRQAEGDYDNGLLALCCIQYAAPLVFNIKEQHTDLHSGDLKEDTSC